MERKNPLEEIRIAIYENQLFGIENEISQFGVSEEILLICDAIDKYFGIKSNMPSSSGACQKNDARLRGLAKVIASDPQLRIKMGHLHNRVD